MIAEEMKSSCQSRKHYNTKVPESIKSEVGNYGLVHGTKAVLEKFGKKYPKYTFVRTSVNNWKKKISDGKDVHRKKGRPNLLNDELLSKERM